MRLNLRVSGVVLLASAGVVLLPGCSLKNMLKKAKDQKLAVIPTPLELHGDSVKFELSALLPVKMLKPNKQYSVTLDYVYKDKRELLGDIVFKGNDFKNSNIEQPKISRNFSFYYKTDDMARGEVYVMGAASNINGRLKANPSEPLPDNMGKGVITTPRLTQQVTAMAYAPHGYDNRETFTPTRVEFFFDKNSAVLKTAEIKSTRGMFLDNFVKGKNSTRTVTITGHHSPEGTEARNTSLAEQRAKAIESYFKSVMKKFNYQQTSIDSIEFVTRSVVLNWQQFKDSLAVSKLFNDDEKSSIVSVVDGAGDFFEKEAQLQKLPSYNKILNGIYPKIRSAETEILTVAALKPDSRILFLAQKIAKGEESPDALSEAELMYAATLTPLPAEKEAIYQAATKKYDSWASHNNLAAVWLDQAKKLTGNERTALVDKAMASLRIAQKRDVNAIVMSNMAAAYFLKDNLLDATTYLTTAYQLKPDQETRKVVNSMRGVAFIRQGTYDLAVKTLTDAVKDPLISYNLALAQVCAKNYEAAASSLAIAQSQIPNNSYVNYLAAIIAARQGKEDVMAQSLQRAIAADANLRAKALEDMEFFKYAGTDKFKNAVK